MDAMSSPGLQPIRSGSRQFAHNLIERVILVLVITGSFWAIWWSFTRLRALQSTSRQLNQQVARLTADIDLMRAQWSASRTQEVTRRFEMVRGNLFSGELSINEWSDTVIRDSIPLALDTRFQLAATRLETNGATTVTRVQANLDLLPSSIAKASRPLYNRVVDWARLVSGNPRRVDLIGLTLNASATGGGFASVSVELWADDKPSASAPAPKTSPLPAPPIDLEADPAPLETEAPLAQAKLPSPPTP
jgi:outer membrane murein-binding lipoprotein Lpp